MRFIKAADAQKPLEEQLVLHGYLKPNVPHSPSDIAAALAAWQKVLIGESTGVVDSPTQRMLDTPRFCAVPDRVSGGQRCRWDGTARPLDLTWWLDGMLPGISAGDLKALCQSCIDNSWSQVSAVSMKYATSMATANLVVKTSNIDRPGGTLAWCELPCGPDQQLTMMVDTSEPFYYSPVNGIWLRAPARKVSFSKTFMHELGHYWGIDHQAEGNLMAPFLDDSIIQLMPAEIKEMTDRYGQPVNPPTPDPVDFDIVLHLDEGMPTYKMIKCKSFRGIAA
jgi:hypothetical protein